jgi:hypothetical protein
LFDWSCWNCLGLTCQIQQMLCVFFHG